MSGAAAPRPLTHRKPISERLIEAFLFLAAGLGVVTTVGIILVLTFETLQFFFVVPPLDFFFGTVWSASIKPYAFGVLALISGTLLVAAIALVIAVPLGLLAAFLLSEYASPRVRSVIKPVLETIAGIPTIVLGFFALYFLTPYILKPIIGTDNIGTFSALSAGIVVGVLITPLIASISEDSMRAVPRGMREGAYAMGSTRYQTAVRVIFPAAFSGVAAAYILGISRAVGETMILAVAAGMQPNLTFNPLEPAATITAYIVQVALGDLPHGSIGYQTIFAAGLTLFLLTLGFNVLGYFLRKRYREVY